MINLVAYMLFSISGGIAWIALSVMNSRRATIVDKVLYAGVWLLLPFVAIAGVLGHLLAQGVVLLLQVVLLVTSFEWLSDHINREDYLDE